MSVHKFQNFHKSRKFFTLLLGTHPVPDQMNPNIPFLQHSLQNYPQSYAQITNVVSSFTLPNQNFACNLIAHVRATYLTSIKVLKTSISKAEVTELLLILDYGTDKFFVWFFHVF